MHAPSIPMVYDANFLRIDEMPRDVDDLVRLADEHQAHLFHRRIEIDRGGDRVASRFRALGWTVTPHLVMAHRREPDRRVDTSTVREVSFERLAPVRAETSPPDYTQAVRDALNEAKRRVARATRQRWFAIEVDGTIAAYCELRSDGRLAQIEDVNTLERFRGRGLGRAIVQHALDEARPTHDLVFLEALEDDWPRHLYAKLGFDVVDRRWLFLRPPHPLTQLVLRTPRLELRLGTVAELRALGELARAGVHPADEMPFAVAWTDRAHEPSFVDDFVDFHLSAIRGWSAENWTLNLLAFHDGRVVGTQGMSAKAFARERTVSTGSWLGRQWQGRGLGTEMRAAVLELAFEGLGAEAALSGALVGNEKSLGVSRKLGYAVVGRSEVAPRGTPAPHDDLRRERAGWRSPVPVEIEGLDSLRPLFGC